MVGEYIQSVCRYLLKIVDAWYINHWSCVQDLIDLLQNNTDSLAVSTSTLYTYGGISDIANAKNLQEFETKVGTDIFNINHSLVLIYQMMLDMGMSPSGAQSAVTCLLIEESSTYEARSTKAQLVDNLISDWHNYMVWKEFNERDMPFEDTKQINTKCAAFLSNFRVGILQILPAANADVLLDSITKSGVEDSNTNTMANLIRVAKETKSHHTKNIENDILKTKLKTQRSNKDKSHLLR